LIRPFDNSKLSEVPQVRYLSKKDLLSYSVNVYNDGNVLSIVSTSGSHGTHVAGIIGANCDDELLNGVAPGCEFISFKIGDNRLGTMETGTAFCRAVCDAVRMKCDIINISYGEP